MDELKMREIIMNDIQLKLNWLKENTKLNIIYIAAQGSMNYGMWVDDETYHSDIDVKAICIPSLEDVIKGNKMFSYTYIMDDNSHIDVKDIRLYSELWKKSNPQFLEILFTDYYICLSDEFKSILSMADEIVRADRYRLISCIKGMQLEKRKALTHPYPSIKDKIDKYGYDTKQLHHIYRLYDFFNQLYIENKSFRNALIPYGEKKETCLSLKTTPMGDLDYVLNLADKYVNDLKELSDLVRRDNHYEVNTETHDKMDGIVYDIVTKHIKNSIIEESNMHER